MPLARFAWLPAGGGLELSTGSTLTLLLLDGRRFALSGPLRAVVSARGVEPIETTSGSVVELPSAAVPEILAIAPGERAATRPGAIRVRGHELRGLYPDAAASSLAHRTTLSFDLDDFAARYHVTVVDPQGRELFATDTQASRVEVPPDVLRPGQTYLWRVATLDHPLQVLRGEAPLRTVGEDAARAREALAIGLADRLDPAALLALGEIDRRLGLLAEARAGVAAALAHAPNDPALTAAAAELRQAIEQAALEH